MSNPESTIETPAETVTPETPDASQPVEKAGTLSMPDSQPAEPATATPQLTNNAAKIVERLKLESKVRAEYEKAKAARAEVEASKAEIESYKEHLNQVQSQFKEYMQRLKADPVAVLYDEFGIGPEEYLQRAQGQGKPAQSEILFEQLKSARQELAQLSQWKQQFMQEQIAQQENWAKQQAEQRQREAHAEHQQAQSEFWGLIESNKAKFPDLSIYPRDVVLQVATSYVAQLGAKADDLSYEDIAQQLQDSTRKQHELIRQGYTPAQAAQISNATPAEKVANAGKKVQRREANSLDVIPKPTLSGNLSQRGAAKTGQFDIDTVKKQIAADLAKAAE